VVVLVVDIDFVDVLDVIDPNGHRDIFQRQHFQLNNGISIEKMFTFVNTDCNSKRTCPSL
jgi:hypothetical protein